jgi:prepilin-type N-terminal cleavage/methylation domain-containing protein
MITNSKGFTLVELIVVMAVFIVILVMAGNAFNSILTQNVKVSSSEESNIEGIIGLEMFRHDLEQAGFGLPSGPSPMPTYSEAADAPASGCNESANAVPRAVVAQDSLTTGVLANTDYLAIKGTTLGQSPASQRWTYVDSTGVPNQWASDNLTPGDRVIVLQRSFTETGVTNQLLTDDSSGSYEVIYSDSAFPIFPAINNQVYHIYGVDSGTLTMPFNRSDYYVRDPGSMPSRCARHTGILYKAVVNQSDGTLTEMPVMDCIADMQVVFGWDSNGDGVIDTSSNGDGTAVSGTASQSDIQALMGSADGVRNSLKLIKVYILAQDGTKDRLFTNPNPTIVMAPGETTVVPNYNLQANQLNYRWKVYRVVVKPKNLAIE